MAGVSVRAVRKAYGATAVIHGVDVEIADGEFVVLVGPSGCGKSTLLRMIAGLEEISGGEIAIGARVVNHLPPKERDVAMVFQNYALYPHMTVRDNMAFSLTLRKADKAEIEKRVKRAAEILNLEPYLERYPKQLSGGQRQRVAMGRAIVRDPQVFLFDEPLSNLDAKLRVQMRIEIRRLHQSIRTTSIYVTHDQVEAMTLADRLIVMNAGHAEQVGAPLEVYERPASVFVAGFIGAPAMNLLRARVAGGRAIAGAAALPLPQAAGLGEGREIDWGVRPEHVELAPGAADADAEVAVDLVEALGADTLVHARLADGGALTLRLPGTTRVREGDRLPLRLPPAALHAFDAASGRRI
jgi:sn-glycerol 3-phosphate transport system ATP-binding protein